MDLKKYFRKVREIEASITEPYVLISSLETSDGGKPGVISEVSRAIAATLIAEGRAALASETEIRQFTEGQASARKAIEKADFAKRLQVTIIGETGENADQFTHPKTSKK